MLPALTTRYFELRFQGDRKELCVVGSECSRSQAGRRMDESRFVPMEWPSEGDRMGEVCRLTSVQARTIPDERSEILVKRR